MSKQPFYLTDTIAQSINSKCLLVESEFKGIYYAICREGKGMWLLAGDKEISISANYADKFISELKDVWETFRP